MRYRLRAATVTLALAALQACGGNPPAVDAGDAGGPDVHRDAGPPVPYCSQGTDVPGAVVPAGYCMRVFAQVNSARRLVVAPGGDVFVAAPSTFAPGGSHSGPGAILVLSDDDGDGQAELHTFLDNVPDVHGLALGGGYLYFTTSQDVMRVAYTDGQRAATGQPESLRAPGEFGTGGRWTHGLALTPGGSLFASRGEYAQCGGTMGGTIYAANAGAFSNVATGFRNPMYMRCHYRDEVCVAAELGEDGSNGATEKLLAIRSGTNYGYPCCFTTGSPAQSGSNCASVAHEEVSIPLNDTPFGMDWERGLWTGAYANALFVALHGSFYSSPQYQGASVIYYPTDATTHLPSTTVPQQFIGGWGHRAQTDSTGMPLPSPMSRPADIAFAPDGRMFIADDTGNLVYLVAPVGLMAAGR